MKTLTTATVKFNDLNEINYYKSILNKMINIYDKNFNKIYDNVQFVAYDSYNLFIMHNNKVKLVRKEALGMIEEA
jgi:uncharacterized membrane protein SpoIIM required for sporulation